MEPVREAWTDERLDDLIRKVDAGFRDLRSEMNTRFDRMDARFDSMQRTMVQAVVAMSAAFLAGFGGLAALIATQL